MSLCYDEKGGQASLPTDGISRKCVNLCRRCMNIRTNTVKYSHAEWTLQKTNIAGYRQGVVHILK